jgi:hypothetical protein
MSRSVFCTHRHSSSRLPDGTGFLQDVACRIVVAVKHESAMRTHMGAHTQGFLHDAPTPATIL